MSSPNTDTKITTDHQNELASDNITSENPRAASSPDQQSDPRNDGLTPENLDANTHADELKNLNSKSMGDNPMVTKLDEGPNSISKDNDRKSSDDSLGHHLPSADPACENPKAKLETTKATLQEDKGAEASDSRDMSSRQDDSQSHDIVDIKSQDRSETLSDQKESTKTVSSVEAENPPTVDDQNKLGPSTDTSSLTADIQRDDDTQTPPVETSSQDNRLNVAHETSSSQITDREYLSNMESKLKPQATEDPQNLHSKGSRAVDSPPAVAICPFSEQPVHDNSHQHIDAKTQGAVKKTPKESSACIQHPLSTVNEDPTAPASNDDTVATECDQATASSSASHPLEQSQERGVRHLFPVVNIKSDTEKSTIYNPLMDESSEDLPEQAEDTPTDGGEKGDIVLVTGGCGFLGQHVIKMLQLRAPHVSEIWVLDLEPFERKLDYLATKRVKTLVGDITDAKFVAWAVNGANSVIHIAGQASWGTFPDMKGMERTNVTGTLNVFNACIKNNVQRLIYCSTVDVAVGGKPIRNGEESNTPVPDKFLFPGYPDTKYHGERIIKNASKLKRVDGGDLLTVILRANVLYGELDNAYVTNALRSARKSKGILHQIGNGKAKFQQAYVGNTAWAFVCADAIIRGKPELSGEIFYIPDNTPVQNSFAFMEPFLEARGFQLSHGHLSYALTHSAVSAAETFVKGISPLVKLNLPVQSHTIAYINTDLYFSGAKAERLLGYRPIFTFEEAMRHSMQYYVNVDLDEKSPEK